MLRLVYMGKLADLAGMAEQAVPAAGSLDWEGLLALLPSGVGNSLRGEKVKVALNGVLVADKTALKASDGDEIAFLPPVSGG
jgi:sulfur-carrier protein